MLEYGAPGMRAADACTKGTHTADACAEISSLPYLTVVFCSTGAANVDDNRSALSNDGSAMTDAPSSHLLSSST